MSTTYRTCHHFHDDGRTCNSAAVTGQRYCSYHLNHRARLMRMAKARARNERFDLKLPPLESMHAVMSAFSQLGEALAADMIELKRADRLIRVFNSSARYLMKSDKWPATPYHAAEPGPAVDLAADYGLPQDLNLDTPPKVAFPPPEAVLSDLSSRTEGEGSAFSVGGRRSPGGPQLPEVGNCGDDDDQIRPDSPVTPEMVEIVEISRTQGADAAALRAGQLERNRQRRQLRTDRKRYAQVALQHNLQRAAEKLAQQKLADKQAQDQPAAKKPPASVAAEAAVDTAEKSALSPTG